MLRGILIFIVFCASSLWGQYVTITGNVTDPKTHIAYQNATGTATLISGNGQPSSWTIGGTNPVKTPVNVNLDSFGNFTTTLTNTCLVDQQGSQPVWQFSWLSAQYANVGSVTFTGPTLALCSNQDITAQITAVPPAPIPVFVGGGGGTGCIPSALNKYDVLIFDGSGGCTGNADFAYDLNGDVTIGGNSGFGNLWVSGDATGSDSFGTNGTTFNEYSHHGGNSKVVVDNKEITGSPGSGPIALSVTSTTYKNGVNAWGIQATAVADSSVNNANILNGIMGGIVGKTGSGAGVYAESTSGQYSPVWYTANYVGNVTNSDGTFSCTQSGTCSKNSWGGIFFGKTWTQDIQIQPEAPNANFSFLPGVASNAAMSQVTCDASQRGRIHYVNSASGTNDVLEVCMQTPTTWAWVPLLGGSTGGGCSTSSLSSNNVLTADGSGGCTGNNNFTYDGSGNVAIAGTSGPNAGSLYINNGQSVGSSNGYAQITNGYFSSLNHMAGSPGSMNLFHSDNQNYPSQDTNAGVIHSESFVYGPNHFSTAIVANASNYTGSTGTQFIGISAQAGGYSPSYSAIGVMADVTTEYGHSDSGFTVGFFAKGASSDGNSGGAYNAWGLGVTRGKSFFQDIVIQPEANPSTWFPGYTTGGSLEPMSQVVCNSTQRGRIHYINSASGTPDALEVCEQNSTGYAWMTLGSGGGGGGSVTNVSSGNLPPLFTTTVASATTTPSISFTATASAGNTIFGNVSTGSAVPSFMTVPACGDATHALSWVSGTGFGCQAITSGGTGTVTSFSSTNLSPLFTTSVATPTTTPALSFALSSQSANTVFGNFTGSSVTPSFNPMTACGDGTHALSWIAGTGFGCQALTTGGGGTVTSVGLTASPSFLSVTGSPVTTSGTLNITAAATGNGSKVVTSIGLTAPYSTPVCEDGSGNLVDGGCAGAYYAQKYCSTPGTLDQSCITNALAAMPSSGGVLLLGAGTYNFASTVTISTPVTIQGVGASINCSQTGCSTSQPPYLPATKLNWIGGTNTNMMLITPSGANAAVGGVNLRNLTFDANTVAGVNAIDVNCMQQSKWDVVSISNANVGTILECRTGANTMLNTFTQIEMNLVATGIVMDGPYSGACSTTCGDAFNNTFTRLHIVFTGTAGIDIKSADNNQIMDLTIYRQSGTGPGIWFRAPSGSGTTGRLGGTYTYIYHYQPTTTAGAQFDAGANVIHDWDVANGQAYPSWTGTPNHNLVTTTNGTNTTISTDTGGIYLRDPNPSDPAPSKGILVNNGVLTVKSNNQANTLLTLDESSILTVNKLKLNVGVTQGVGLQTEHSASFLGSVTGTTFGASVQDTFNWPIFFPDNNYVAVCSPYVAQGMPGLGGITHTSSTITITTINLYNAGLASQAAWSCIAIHD